MEQDKITLNQLIELYKKEKEKYGEKNNIVDYNKFSKAIKSGHEISKNQYRLYTQSFFETSTLWSHSLKNKDIVKNNNLDGDHYILFAITPDKEAKDIIYTKKVKGFFFDNGFSCLNTIVIDRLINDTNLVDIKAIKGRKTLTDSTQYYIPGTYNVLILICEYESKVISVEGKETNTLYFDVVEDPGGGKRFLNPNII